MAFYDEVKAQEDIPYRDNIIRSRVTEWPVGSGEFYLDVRQWYSLDGQWQPTKKGITLPVGLWPDVVTAIGKLGF